MNTKTELKELKLDDIIISRTNPRKHFDEESINELAQSIIEKGVLQPIVVRLNGKPGKYELVCGERRLRASKVAQTAKKTITTIPAVIRELTDDEALELQIIENLQRKDIHPMEEAVAFKGLMVMKKMDVKEIAGRVGKSPNYVAQRVKMNDLIEPFQKAFYQDRMTIQMAVTVARLRPEDQKEIWEEEFEDNDHIKVEVGKWILNKYNNSLNDAPFDKADPTLNKAMGACGGCPFNSASNSLLFPEEANNAICLNTACYKIKCGNYFAKELKAAKDNPETVLVSTSYSMGKDAKDLIAKGEKVYAYGQFDKEDKPEAPDLNDDYAYDPDDYESDKERMDDFNRDVKEHEKELKEYEKKITSGKFLKAFVVEGDDKGRYVYIELRKGKAEAKPTGAALKAKQAEGTVTADDIKVEIQRVKDGEKRKKEIDHEKIHYATDELFQKNKKFKENQGPLSVEETRAAILFIFENNHHAKGICEKLVKSQGSYSNSDFAVFKKLEAMKYNELNQILSAMLRHAFLNKLAPIKGGSNQRPDANGHAAAFTAVAKLYIPKEIAEIEMNQLNERANREVKVEARIKSLTNKMKELPSQKEKKPNSKPAVAKKP